MMINGVLVVFVCLYDAADVRPVEQLVNVEALLKLMWLWAAATTTTLLVADLILV